MMRSLFAGVSGLQNHQTRMDVVGNNIANVNTYGFKKGRVTFQDMLSQTLIGAAKPREDKGGVNPQQVGLGMQVAAIDTIHTQGTLKVTGVNTDLALVGEGFFVLQKGDQTFYSRNGAFSIDKDGTLVNPANGLKVQGWMGKLNDKGESVIENASFPTDIKIPMNDKDPARATANIRYQCNLRKTDTTHAGDIRIYDNTGVARQVKASFAREEIENTNTRDINVWKMTLNMPEDQIVPGSIQAYVGKPGGGEEIITGNAGQYTSGEGEETVVTTASKSKDIWLTFDNNGALVKASNSREEAIAADTLQAAKENAGKKVEATLIYEYAGTTDTGNITQEITLDLGNVGELKGITQTESVSTTKAVEQDGWSMGMLQAFTIDESGTITGVYTNGNRRALAQVAVAKFTNPGGLEKSGESMFVQSNNSGPANVGPADIMGRGKIKAGALEMSNVDLAEEFSDMIVTQRGFQANSRSITTSDQMLQELLSLKR